MIYVPINTVQKKIEFYENITYKRIQNYKNVTIWLTFLKYIGIGHLFFS